MTTVNWRIEVSTPEDREKVRTIQRSKYSDIKKCFYCNEKFDYGYSSLKICGCCKIFVNCSIYGMEFELNFNNYSGSDQRKINDAIKNKENLNLFCSKECRKEGQIKSYEEYFIKNNDKFYNSMKNRKYSLNCKIHGNYIGNNHTSNCQKCLEEFNKSENVKLYEKLINVKDCIEKDGFLYLNIDKSIKNRNYSLKYCESCNREFRPTTSNQKVCKCCYKVMKCPVCNNKYVVSKGYEDQSIFCSIRCSVIKQQKDGLANKPPRSNNVVLNNPEIFFPKDSKILDYKKFNKISGIWYKYDPVSNIVLDVCLTNDIYKEIVYHNYQILSPTKQKYKEISKLSKIDFYYLCNIESWEDGLIKEKIFALKTKAKFWSPAPGIQNKK